MTAHHERAPINPTTRAVWRLANCGIDARLIMAICHLTPTELAKQYQKLRTWGYTVQSDFPTP